MYNETSDTINEWATETFGTPTLMRAATRCNQEVSELLAECAKPYCDERKVADECADILITLYRVAELVGVDLHAQVDAKMAINRARTWAVDGSGCGYHVKAK